MIPVEIPNLKRGQRIRFENDNWVYVVTSIYKTPVSDNIIAECYPENANVSNPTMFNVETCKITIIE
jgi:hypothetical protein